MRKYSGITEYFQPQTSGFYTYHRLYGKFLLFWALQLSTISFVCICLVLFPSPKILLVALRHERLLHKLASLAVWPLPSSLPGSTGAFQMPVTGYQCRWFSFPG